MSGQPFIDAAADVITELNGARVVPTAHTMFAERGVERIDESTLVLTGVRDEHVIRVSGSSAHGVSSIVVGVPRSGSERGRARTFVR
jgi:hypothetical protein